MSKEIIKCIEIEIAGVTVKVSPKQAKELFRALADLLGEQTYKMTVYPIRSEPPLWTKASYYGPTIGGTTGDAPLPGKIIIN